MKKLKLLEEADADLEEHSGWYDDREPGLGAEFRAAVRAALERIGQDPKLFPIAKREVRRCVIRRFPFTIFFVIGSQEILVLRILHTSRMPLKW